MFLLIAFGFVAFVLLFIFLIIFLRKWIWKSKGERGELYVANILRSLNENEYTVLNDIMVRTKNGGTSQIDHIVVSVYGLFVIETKNYSGWIFGKENAEYWTQVFYRSDYTFRNPIKQNQSHVFALKNLLSSYRNITYIPVVVFVGSAELKDVESSVPVIYGSQLLSFIHSESTARCLSETDVRAITDLLLSKNISDEGMRAEHIQNIRQYVLDRNLKMENLICPRCNGELKLREGRTGRFYGCSHYPRCHFTMPY